MPKIVITYEYETDLSDYPTFVKNTKDAMLFDADMVMNGNLHVEELLDLDGKMTIDVVD
jgi:hypothetical protein